jgi:hypothetical protein
LKMILFIEIVSFEDNDVHNVQWCTRDVHFKDNDIS